MSDFIEMIAQMILQSGAQGIISGVLVGIGVLAILVGVLGLIRMPCVFSRSHGVGMMDTAGVGFVILGLLVHEGFTLISIKLAFVGVFLFFTSPMATHALVQVAHRSGVKPAIGKGEGATWAGARRGGDVHSDAAHHHGATSGTLARRGDDVGGGDSGADGGD